jgi:hypothetical protein
MSDTYPADREATLSERWLELTGTTLDKRGKDLPDTLLTSIATMQGAAGVAMDVFIRREEGSGCEWRAEIAGWYQAPIPPGGACLGAAAVLNILNAAATAVCLAHQCPLDCPCGYDPRAQLALYECTATIEKGYLLQGDRVWNCQCGVIA